LTQDVPDAPSPAHYNPSKWNQRLALPWCRSLTATHRGAAGGNEDQTGVCPDFKIVLNPRVRSESQRGDKQGHQDVSRSQQVQGHGKRRGKIRSVPDSKTNAV
jgi:hypothetical protein